MSRMLLVDPEYYEEQKRIHENIARLERERLLIEQSITAERAAVNATAAQNANAWKERLEGNIKNAKLKIEENREIMRRVDRLLFKIDAALDDCEYLESLKENMVNYAKEAYERWRSEDPERAARYWAERHSKETGGFVEDPIASSSMVEKTKETPTSFEEDYDELPELQMTSPRKFSKSPVPDLEKSTSSILKKKNSIDDTSENGALGQSYTKKSPRFSDHVEIAEFEKVSSRDGGLEAILCPDFSGAITSENTSLQSSCVSPEKSQPSKGSPRKEKQPKKDPKDMTPLEFFSARSSYSGPKSSGFKYGDSAMSSEDSIITSEENVPKKVNTNFNGSTFTERRSFDEKNEFLLGGDDRDNETDFDNAVVNTNLTLLGLQALLSRIEMSTIDVSFSKELDSLYCGNEESTDIDYIVRSANKNELGNISPSLCCHTVVAALPSILANERLLTSQQINYEEIQYLEQFSKFVAERNEEVFKFLCQHLVAMVSKHPNLVEKLSRHFAKLFVGHNSSHLGAMQETLYIILSKQLNLDASHDEASITHISMATPRSNRVSSPIVQGPELSDKPRSNASEEKRSSKELSLPERSFQRSDVKDKVRQTSKDADANDDDDDSFPFTSQSIDDHLNFSLQSDPALKTSNAYQSLLQSAFGPATKATTETGADSKSQSGQFKVSDFVAYESDDEDEIEGQLMRSGPAASNPKNSPEKESTQKFYSMRTKDERALSPKRSGVANNESRDLFSSGEEESSLVLSSARSKSKKDAIGITADVRSSLARKPMSGSNSLTFTGGSAVALKDFGDIDLGVSDEEGQNSTTDILGITPRDKHLADDDSDDSDFFG